MRIIRRLVASAAGAVLSLLATTSIAAPGDLDPTYLSPPIPNLTSVELAADGGWYFFTDERVTEARITGAYYDYVVTKYLPDRSLDASWGVNGKVAVEINPVIARRFIRTWTLDGGLLLALQKGNEWRFDKHGKPVFGFPLNAGISELPKNPTGSASPWQFLSIVELPNSEFRIVWTYTSIAREQLFAVRRFASNGTFLGETIYRLNLDVFNSVSSQGQVSRRESVYPRIIGFRNGNLQVVELVANEEYWLQLELSPDGKQIVVPKFDLGSIQDIEVGNVIQSPNGKLAAIMSTRRSVGEWLATGQFNRDLIVRGPSWPSGILDLDCVGGLAIHANGRYSVRASGRSNMRPFAAVSCDENSYGFLMSPNVGDPSLVVKFGFWWSYLDSLGRYYVSKFEIHHDALGFVESTNRLDRYEGFGPIARVKVVEYYAPANDRYFITAHPHEINDLDKPATGWQRTGRYFHAWNIDTPMPNTNTVCRYYGDPQAGPNSHFFSALPYECNLLREIEATVPLGKPAWRFERDAFRITPPVDGKCENGLFPVTRFYNGKSGERGVPNHRYVTREPDIEEMTAKGWINEGVRMCAVL
jgi:hypothetical protein